MLFVAVRFSLSHLNFMYRCVCSFFFHLLFFWCLRKAGLCGCALPRVNYLIFLLFQNICTVTLMYLVAIYWNCLTETIPVSTHKIYCGAKRTKILNTCLYLKIGIVIYSMQNTLIDVREPLLAFLMFHSHFNDTRTIDSILKYLSYFSP